jgi:diguanylate cyclase (GGDEF)-like protein
MRRFRPTQTLTEPKPGTYPETATHQRNCLTITEAHDVTLEVRLAFLRELVTSHKKAVAAHKRLLTHPSDRRAIEEVYRFFHGIAGTASSVDLPLLGHLAAVCERLAKLVVDRVIAANEILPQFAQGIAGVASILDDNGVSAGIAPSQTRRADAATSLGWSGVERAMSKVLVIDDDPLSAGLIDGCLRAAGFLSLTCSEPERAITLVTNELPDLVLLDVVMPDLDGFELCRRIRAHPAMQFTPIIFVTRRDDLDERVRGLEVGGNDYIAKPFEPLELVARIRSHLARLAALREMAIRDGLTRCYNHKYFKERLVQEIQRSRRYNSPLAIGMLDIDNFKRVNDDHGHIAGDAVLAHLSDVVVASVRSTDVVARYGGEEFGILLVQSGAAEAAIVTNRLRERVANQRFAMPEPGSSAEPAEIPITVSIGVAQLAPDDEIDTLLSRADVALYEAKAAGRNQVRVVKVP